MCCVLTVPTLTRSYLPMCCVLTVPMLTRSYLPMCCVLTVPTLTRSYLPMCCVKFSVNGERSVRAALGYMETCSVGHPEFIVQLRCKEAVITSLHVKHGTNLVSTPELEALSLHF